MRASMPTINDSSDLKFVNEFYNKYRLKESDDSLGLTISDDKIILKNKSSINMDGKRMMFELHFSKDSTSISASYRGMSQGMEANWFSCLYSLEIKNGNIDSSESKYHHDELHKDNEYEIQKDDPKTAVETLQFVVAFLNITINAYEKPHVSDMSVETKLETTQPPALTIPTTPVTPPLMTAETSPLQANSLLRMPATEKNDQQPNDKSKICSIM